MNDMIQYMKTMPSAMAPFLRSETQGRLLAEIFFGAGEHTISSLGQAADTSPATAMREVDRLEASGYVKGRHYGKSRVVTANEQHPLYRPLREIIRYSYGPVPILHDLLEGHPDIDQALIFGSWAERASGIPGHNPNDIDVLAIGAIRPRAAAALANDASELLGKEVNIRVSTLEAWKRQTDGLAREIASRPTVDLHLHSGAAA